MRQFSLEKFEERQPRNIRDNSDSRFYDARNNRNRTEDFKGRESIFRSPNESGWPPARSRHDRKRPHGNPRFVPFCQF